MLKTIQCKDFEEMGRKAADFIAQEITSAKKQYSIAFPGGNSVTGLLENLAEKKLGWQAVNAFMADERIAAITDRESNYRQANELFFSKAPGIHAFAFGLQKGAEAWKGAEAQKEVEDYNKKFMSVTKGKLDMVVLGVGEDGHIASLFPGHEALKSSGEGYILAEGCPKPPPKRVTLSPKAVSSAGTVVLLFASDAKNDAYKKFLDKNLGEGKCPAKIALKAERTFVFTVFGDKTTPKGEGLGRVGGKSAG